VEVDRTPEPLNALPSSYRPLFERVLTVCEKDPRIRALWLSGSLATGAADGGSDLDTVIAVRDDDFDDFVAHWRDWLRSITPTLIARELPFAPGSFYSTTIGCERLDVIAERVSSLPETPHRVRRVVFDRDGLDATVPAPEPIPGPDPAKLLAIVEEFFRILAISPFMLNQRRDYLVVLEGIHTLRKMLYDVFVESNQPMPARGIKQWSAKLTPDQLDVLQGLPAATPDREALAPALRAVVEAMRTAGRQAVVSTGCPWPVRLENGVMRFFDQALSHPSARDVRHSNARLDGGRGR
jgi:Nucleotidyltransferase domain